MLNISLFVGETSLGSLEGLSVDDITASLSLAQLREMSNMFSLNPEEQGEVYQRLLG